MRSYSEKILQFTLLIFIVLVSLQVMNQILIYTGNKLFSLLPAQNDYKLLIVGIYQQSFQILTAILLSRLILKIKLADIGVNFWNFKRSIKYFIIFASSILIVYFLYLMIVRFLIPSLWVELQSAAIPSNQEILNKLFFQSIFPGLGEELLFRGFLVTFLILRLDINLSKFKDIFLISVISGLFFAVAHIYFDISPFQITHIDITQLLLALFSGTCYSLMFIKTKSLVGPILSHNFSNVSSTIIGLLISSH